MFEAVHALRGAAKVLMFGTQKYSRGNWRNGLPLTQVADSLGRHLTAFLAGETHDPETGMPHVDFIVTNSLFLAEMYHTRPDLDDRPVRDNASTPQDDHLA